MEKSFEKGSKAFLEVSQFCSISLKCIFQSVHTHVLVFLKFSIRNNSQVSKVLNSIYQIETLSSKCHFIENGIHI